MKNLHSKPQKYPETKEYYYVDVPVYERWEKVMEPDYCDSCGQETGEYETLKGVNLLGYEKKKFKKDSIYFMNKILEKNIKPLIVESIVGRLNYFSHVNKKGEKLNIPKI